MLVVLASRWSDEVAANIGIIPNCFRGSDAGARVKAFTIRPREGALDSPTLRPALTTKGRPRQAVELAKPVPDPSACRHQLRCA